MRRRKFLGVLGGAAAWPLAAHAQQPAVPVVGFMSAGSLGPLRQALAGFEDGLKGSRLHRRAKRPVEYRFAEGQTDRFPALVSELVGRKVAVLAVSSNAGVQAAKQATATIPIVFSVGEDPVNNRPGCEPQPPRRQPDRRLSIRFGARRQASRTVARARPQGHDLGGAHPSEQPALRIAVARRAGGGGPPRRATRCRARQCGKRIRRSILDRRPAESSCASGLRIAVLQSQTTAACRAGGTPRAAGDL